MEYLFLRVKDLSVEISFDRLSPREIELAPVAEFVIQVLEVTNLELQFLVGQVGAFFEHLDDVLLVVGL